VALAVERALERVPGVSWAQIDPVLHRVVLGAVESLAPDDAICAIEEVEADFGVAQERFSLDGPEHPGDKEPVVRHVLALGADVAGLSLGVVGRVLRATPLPVEVASVVTLIDNEPRLRHMLESHLGTPTTDLGLAVLNAVGQSLTQGPLGLMTDGIHRVNLLREASARRGAFKRAEATRWGTSTEPERQREPVVRNPRPVPLPDGPIERHSDRASLVGAATAAATFAATGSARRGAAMLLAAAPKASRMGRESFASHVDRSLSDRDLLVLDHGALRRLDRVDTLVVDGSLLGSGSWAIRGLRLLEGADAPDAVRHLQTMFDPANPLVARRRGRWSLGVPERRERQRTVIRRAGDELSAERLLVLRCENEPVAVVGIAVEYSASVLGLMRSARRQGLMLVLAYSAPPPMIGVDIDLYVAGGPELAGAIEALQEDGCVVALLSPGGPLHVEALLAADVGLELPDLDGASWSGDIVINDVDDCAFVLDAIASAREVSRQSVALSVTGSGIGALLALGATPGGAASRASSAINVAALAAIANGWRAATYLIRHGGQSHTEMTRWHELGVDEVLARLGSGPLGLEPKEALARQRTDTGAQAVSPSLGGSILAELANPLTPVLAGGAVASASVGSPADAGIVAGVSALNALIGGAQRYAAERAILSLSEASQQWVSVVRNGEVSVESTDRLVPGEIVLLRAGDAVPSDCRVLSAHHLEVDESSLTGESDTVGKDPRPTYSAVMAEHTSMLYEGTTIAAGEATAVVVAIGSDTAANALLADLADTRHIVGVEARLRSLTSLTLPIAGFGGASVLALGLLRGRTLNQSVGSAVALAVAAVPEGLPILATMAQLASARRLSKRQALVRNPRVIEALGRVRVLCTDKTGTLTEGRIQLRGCSDGTEDVSIGAIHGHWEGIVAAGLRASPAAGSADPLPHLTDRAVVGGAVTCGVLVDLGAPQWRRVAELPFEPVRGYHAVLAMTGDNQATGDRALLSVKGAPETVLPRCRSWRRPTGTVALDIRLRRRLDREVDRLARQGYRILAVAEAESATAATSSHELRDEDVTGLTLLGFLILSDPVRPTAAEAVKALQAAGVTVLMVTGDHPSTAEGIAAELDILNGKRVVTGTQLAAMTDMELDAVITEVSVFARVTPADKVRVVLALQRHGHPVAMTGDGANDAPAIRLADVGIALGDHATPAARRAADLIVTDERIETIVDAIIEGRAMWASLRDALAILLGGNLGEVVFTVAATAVTGRAPLSARQLLAVNLLTDVAPALAIALRAPPSTTPEALAAEGPDASLGHSLEEAIALRAACTALGAGLAWSGARLTGRRQRASTTALVALVGSQLGQTIAIGGRDPGVLVAGFGSAAVLAGIVQTPGVSQFFGCTPLGPVAWTMALGSSAVATGAAAVGARLFGAGGPLHSAAGHDDPPALTE